MVNIRAFKGLHYDPEKVKYDDVITPPYDVISADEAKEYLARSPYNLAHLILTLNNGDNAKDRRRIYQDKKRTFDKWLSEEVIVQDPRPTIYLVEQLASDGEHRRISFIAQVDLEDFRKRLLPHEKIYETPLLDRYRLLKTMGRHTGLPLVLYPDLHRETNNLFEPIMKRPPFVQFIDPLETAYTIWKITDPLIVRQLQKIMKTKSLVIADGHHRISATVKYIKENPAARWMPLACANYHDEPDKVLPTHRIVYNIKRFDIKRLETELTKEHFDLYIFQYSDFDEELQLEKVKQLMAEGKGRVLGMYHKESKRYYALKVKDVRKVIEWMDKTSVASGTSVKKFLDVTWLHYLILDRMLGIHPEQEKSSHIKYVKGSHEDAIREFATKKEYQLLFFLNSIRLRDVYEVASRHDTVPQKTTYFYPKMDSGLAMMTF